MSLAWGSLSWGAAQPLEYEDALQLVQRSSRVTLAEGQLELARQGLAVASSWVQAELSGGYTQAWSTLETDVLSETDSEGDIDPLNLSAAFNVVPFGPAYDRIQQAQWDVERAELALRDERFTAVLELTQQFQGALRAQESLALSEAKLALAELQLAAARTRLEAGAATTSDLLQVELGVQQAQQELSDAQRSYRQALAALSVTLSREVSEVGGELPGSEFALERTDTQLARRSDLTEARLGVANAELTASATLRQNLPSGTLSAGFNSATEDTSISLGAQYGTGGPAAYQPSLSLSYDPDSGPPGVPLGSGFSRSFSLGIGFSVPLDVSLPNALRAAQLSVEQARQRANQALTFARLDADTRASEVAGLRLSLELTEQLLSERLNTLETTEARFDLGLVSPLEVEQARVNAVEAELSLHGAEDALRLAHMNHAVALALSPLEVFE